MFYSHELLTSRKHGVATAWLVATLGSKSGLRRVTRKAIQGVDIEKACATVSDAEGLPLALRLQSNLLYGISRIYFQQCEYVLVDAKHAQNSLRTLWKHVEESQGLDPNAGKAKPENLIIPDDPGFLPDDLIPDPNIDLSFFDSSVASSSIPSILSGAGRISSQSNASAAGIEIPSSISDANQYAIAPAIPGYISHLGIDIEVDEGFDPNIDFGFDEDGNLLDFQPLAEEIELPNRARSGSQVSARARLAFEDDLRIQPPQQNVGVPLIDEHHPQILPEAEPFPTGQLDISGEKEALGVRRARRPIALDKTLQIRVSELVNRDHNYASNMEAAKNAKLPRKNAHQARKNAFHYVLGRGLGDTGLLHGNLVGPLAMFSGAALYEALTGVDMNTIASTYKKRSADPNAETSINKRTRTELARGVGEDAENVTGFFENSIEVAREAPPLPLYDEHSSQMPWNQPPSSRATSRQASILRSTSATAFNKRSHDRIRSERRQTPSSPLHGRGRGHGRPSSLLAPFDDLELLSGQDDMPPISGADESLLGGFDMLTPTPRSQPLPWSTAIDADAKRFLAFIAANAQSVTADESEDIAKATTFSSLLPPADHMHLVAVQGFVHLLTLANEGYVVATQKNTDDIWVGVKSGYEDLELETGDIMGEGEDAMGPDVPGRTHQLEQEEKEADGRHESGDEEQQAAIARLRF